MYDAWLWWKYRPRLTAWGKFVAAWVVVSLPWIAALTYYTITGADLPERLVPLTAGSAIASVAFMIGLVVVLSDECDELDECRLWRRVDEGGA